MRSLKAIVLCGMTIALATLVYSASRRSSTRSSPPSIALIDEDESATRNAPEFELETLDGRAVKLSDFRGKAVVLNFWATYCGPCRVEMPWLIDLYKEYRSRGLEIIGISMDDDGERHQVADFLREFRVNYTIVLGNYVVGDAYGGVRFLPQTFFIDRKGQITGSAVGMKSKQEFETYIKQLLSD